MSDELAKVRLFQTLQGVARLQLGALCEVRRFRRGDTIFEEDRPAEFVWIVKQGVVHLVKQTPQNGLTVIFAMTPHEALCGISAFEHGRYSASAVAATDTQLIKIPANAFSLLLQDHPKFAAAVLSTCCHRIRSMAEVISLAQAPVEQRLAHVLLRLRETFGKTIPITHHELARMAGTRWETSIRTLSSMKRRGWVASSRGKVTILDVRPLQALLRRTNGLSKPDGST